MKYSTLNTDELRRRVAQLPRVDLAHLPTPLEEVPRFSERIGGVRILIKRDDCTGLLFGGNKTRHNEFLLADALHQGADMLIWGAGVQSNNCRQTAASCARLGLECRLYLSRGSHGEEIQGNLLLDHLVGARVEVVDAKLGPELDQFLMGKAEEYRARGRKPYFWDRDRIRPLAAVSYALCVAEIVEELRGQPRQPSAIYVASTGSTGAGVALTKALLGLSCEVHAVSAIKWPWDARQDLAKIANHAAELIGLPQRLRPEEINANEDFIGPAYGAMTEAGWEAIDLLARTEGILLDPVYTAKAMAALIHDIRSRRIPPGETVVFIHTGGTPAVFAYRDDLLPYIKRNSQPSGAFRRPVVPQAINK